MRKQKKSTWHELADDKCPNCKGGLMKDLFTGGFVGCSCGFNLDVKTKDLLVNRDNDGQLQNDEGRG